jgi:hypothetical protein
MSEKLEPTGTSAKKAAQKSRPPWLAILLAILKFLSILFLCVLVLVIGLWIGYVKLGGQPASEIFHISTWKHLYDLVFAK